MKTLLKFITICSVLLVINAAQAEPRPIRFGIAPAMARNQYALLEEWRAYLTDKMKRPVEFIFRDTYRESLDLMRQKKLDFAWFSSVAYIQNMQQTDLLVSPLYQGHPFDRAYLIVSSTDQSTHSLAELKNKVFAYVDTASNTGYLEPRDQLGLAKEDPDQFFRKTFFTRDPLKAIAAVAIGLADGGAVSGFAWETLALSRPDITGQTRIVAKSEEYGSPPIIARHSLNKKDYLQMRQVLLDMSSNPEGVKLLKRINITGFMPADSRLYQSVYLVMKRAGDL